VETTDKDTIAVLNDLIATCKDGVEGFKTAAGAVKSSAAKTLFTSRLSSIEQAAVDLQAAVRTAGGDPTDSGHAAASLHRGWINLKAAVSGKDEHEIIEEAVRGEDAAVTHYREALDKPLPDAVRRLVERQLHGAQQNLASVQALLTTAPASARVRSDSRSDVRS
jgi:uncharacterized protein (TIGR02284 family)